MHHVVSECDECEAFDIRIDDLVQTLNQHQLSHHTTGMLFQIRKCDVCMAMLDALTLLNDEHRRHLEVEG